ncbi:MAG: hypothetical protein DIU65_10415 [Proteobacteria bacterium]|jgi:hypothetical protein|nr:MAG: hypothetical protein DIU65_10415 [Pseudomonadota bacterium]
MWKYVAAAAVLFAGTQGIHAATVVNNDNEPRTLIVTEGAGKSELSIAAGETTEFCLNGCFITLPNGDLEALTGAETVVISNGTATIK